MELIDTIISGVSGLLLIYVTWLLVKATIALCASSKELNKITKEFGERELKHYDRDHLFNTVSKAPIVEHELKANIFLKNGKNYIGFDGLIMNNGNTSARLMGIFIEGTQIPIVRILLPGNTTEIKSAGKYVECPPSIVGRNEFDIKIPYKDTFGNRYLTCCKYELRGGEYKIAKPSEEFKTFKPVDLNTLILPESEWPF